MTTDQEFEQLYQAQKSMNPNRMFFVGSILSDVQECMYRKDIETVERFTSEALYNLRMCQQEDLITPAQTAKIGRDIILGKSDFLGRIEANNVYPVWDEKEWLEFVQPSCSYLNHAKRSIFDLSDKIGRINWKE